MFFMWFSERAYHYTPEEDPERYRELETEIVRERSFWGTPNTYLDRAHCAKLLNQYLDERVYTDTELLNFDGVMLNEHHATPMCLGSVMDVEAAVLARATQRVKIVLLGNPIATTANPLRLSEELAMIDLISGGRLVPGWVRGAGSEQLSNNTNPALNRELFEEGIDVVIQAWTKPGPFRYEGKHFHYRHVNPWVLPLQEPHPPFWIPGLISPDTAHWCAKQRYPYIALATRVEPTLELWDLYAEAAAREGYQAGPENFGYMQPVMVADTQERAEELGKRLLFGGSFAHAAKPEWAFPSGYNSKVAQRRLAQAWFGGDLTKPLYGTGQERTEEEVEGVKRQIYDAYPAVLKDMGMIAGTPDNVLPKLKQLLEVLRPGIFSFWLEGPVPHKDRLRCLELIDRDIIPAMREHGKRLGLIDPFHCAPGMKPLNGSAPEPVSDRAALAV